jgi:AcrR family transcriptional regulator
MARLSRAQTQERNRARILAAARDEFAERGFRDTKIDDIAERAELTRGAVYSNFPGKRALYFAVLADAVDQASAPQHAQHGTTAREALGAFARAWVTQRPFGPDGQAGDDDQYGLARIGTDLMPEIQADQRVRRPFRQLMTLNALLLALALERLQPTVQTGGVPRRRLVRLAETVLTTLHGAATMAAAAPGFVEPFDVISACERLAGLELSDWWAPPPTRPPVRSADEPWSPAEAVDLLSGAALRPTGDGVVVILGLNRAAAVEDAIRAAPGEAECTVALVTSEPAELAALTRLVVAEVAGCLRQAFSRPAMPGLLVMCDESGALAAAAGISSVSDDTEAAVRIAAGRVVARADGSGAGHAVAAAVLDTTARQHR